MSFGLMQQKKVIKGVLFDLDGTLIDTEYMYRICWPAAAEAFGYHMTDEQALQLRSLGRPFAPGLLREWFGEAFDYEAVRRKRKALMNEMIEEKGIAVKAGAKELLEYLREKGLITAVVTATNQKRAAEYLKRIGLYSEFDRIISAVQVPFGKPAPDVYLLACKELGQKPEECIAVEDSPNGVYSAYRAGCQVIMVPDQTRPEEELRKYLTACVPDLAHIKEYL